MPYASGRTRAIIVSPVQTVNGNTAVVVKEERSVRTVLEQIQMVLNDILNELRRTS